MTNVLFDRETLKVVGSNRSSLPFEIEVKNVGFENLSKTISYFEEEDKVTEDNKQLYLFPQQPIEQVIEKAVEFETTEITDQPILFTVNNKVPILDEEGKQVQYEVTETVVISPAVYDEETGGLLEEEITEQRGTGVFIKCYTIEQIEVQKLDKSNKPLFYDSEIIDEITSVEQPPIEITSEDERFKEGLEKALVNVEKFKTVNFNESPKEFTYEDIVNHKEKTITSGTFYGAGKLFETFEGLPNTSLVYNADLGFDFVSIPSLGEFTTVKITLPNSTTNVYVKLETSTDGLEVFVNDIKTVNDEVELAATADGVHLTFKNPTDKRIDIYSFALLV